jgi:hypothetical protein
MTHSEVEPIPWKSTEGFPTMAMKTEECTAFQNWESATICLDGPLCAPLRVHPAEDWWADYWLDLYVRKKYFDVKKKELKDPTMYHGGRLWVKGKILVPYQREQEVISRYHDSPAAGHWGVSRTTAMLKRNHIFGNMLRKVRAYVRTCDICQRGKADTRLPRGHAQSLEIPVRKWESISVDFISLPATVFGGSCEVDEVLTVTDRATKMVHLIPCHHTMDARTVAQLFWWEVVRYHGMPRSIVSDGDKLFMSMFWTELMKFLDVQLRRSSPYHPQTNGQAERTNQTLKQVFRTLLLEKPDSRWVDLLVLAEISINSAPIANMEYSPFYLNYGYHPTFWWDLPETEEPGPEDRKEVVRETVRRMKTEWKVVRAAFHREQQKALAYANRKRANYDFRVGQDVLITRRRHYKGQFGAGKGPLAPRAVGPFTIIRAITPNTFVLDIPKEVRGRATPVFHSRDLIPYETRMLDPVGMLPEDEGSQPPHEDDGDGDPDPGGDVPEFFDPEELREFLAGSSRDTGRSDSPLPPYLPEDPDPAVLPEEDADSRDRDESSDSQEEMDEVEVRPPLTEGAPDSGAPPESTPPRPGEEYEEVEDPGETEELGDDSFPAEDQGEVEGEQELQRGRLRNQAEPAQVLPPSITPQLRWWIDRIRAGDESLDITHGPAGQEETAEVTEQLPDPRGTEESAGEGRGHHPSDPSLSAISEDRFGEVVLKKLERHLPLPAYGAVEDVKMKPEILMRMCQNLLVTPCIDLFASANHHQFPRYYTADPEDGAALGHNAFAYEWSPEVCLYANPPWTLIPLVLAKICADKSRVLLVTPNWPAAPWFPLLTAVAIRQQEWAGRIYLDEAGRLRPPPRWRTLFTYVVGKAVDGSESPLR